MLNWMKDMSALPPETLLLLESCQLGWIDKNYNREAFGVIFRERPAIAWFFAHKRPALKDWVESVKSEKSDMTLAEATCRALKGMEDWVVYAVDPDIYQNQPFVAWDERELTSLTDWRGKRVVDIGSGTGKQAFSVARLCREIYCVEPVANLREYLRSRAKREGLENVRVIDGFLENLPLEDEFADVTMGGHVYGDFPEDEVREITRVTKTGGMMIFIPGGNDRDTPEHEYLVKTGFRWSAFEEPGDGMKRKYWKVKD